ncbi:metallo-beta-lactamase superfamily protein [Stachybotrys elegans]|uniref:Metallo-beta-lactamase superfamily protein n=1 Tax=Stachybotrys elegans TaxID=80388 RepID=A0A8K0T0C7_9HYPO|nr:metallo-beta-lactamase superfamily protein [Stachybotrys elegans]
MALKAARLVALPEVERLSPVCIRILGGNPGKFTLQGTNTYLLGTGRRRILIDTGEGRPAWHSTLSLTLREENAEVETVLISHWHRDHVDGIDDLRRISPAAKIYKNDPGTGHLPLSDGQVFKAEGVTLTAVHTPGHTKDHMVFVLAEEDAMFTADNVLGMGTAVFEDMPTYLASLAKMRDLFKGRAYPGHGPVIDDGPGRIAEYIQHRKEREDQVITTLQSENMAANWEVMELVERIYADVPQKLHEAAAGGVLQILKKLETEGRVVREGEKWRVWGRSTI